MQQLVEANQYRRIRKQCLPMFELASGRPDDLQKSVYRTRVLQIADTLGVEVEPHHLDVEPTVYIEIAPDISGLMESLDRIKTERFFTPKPKYAPGGRVDPPDRIDPTSPPFVRYYDYTPA